MTPPAASSIIASNALSNDLCKFPNCTSVSSVNSSSVLSRTSCKKFALSSTRFLATSFATPVALSIAKSVADFVKSSAIELADILHVSLFLYIGTGIPFFNSSISWDVSARARPI